MKKLLLIPVIIFPYLLTLGVLLGNLFPEDAAPIVFASLLFFLYWQRLSVTSFL